MIGDVVVNIYIYKYYYCTLNNTSMCVILLQV